MESFMCISVQLTLLHIRFFLERHNNKNFMIWLFCVIAFHNEKEWYTQREERNVFVIP